MNAMDPHKLDRQLHSLLCDMPAGSGCHDLLRRLTTDPKVRRRLAEMLDLQDMFRRAVGLAEIDPVMAKSMGRVKQMAATARAAAGTPPRARSQDAAAGG